MRVTKVQSAPTRRDDRAGAGPAHAVRRVPGDRRRASRAPRPAHARRRARVHVGRVRRRGPADRRRPARARRARGRRRRADAGRLLGVPPDRHRGHAPRRRAVLDLLLQPGRADPADDRELRGARGLHAAAVRRDHRGGRARRRTRSSTSSSSSPARSTCPRRSDDFDFEAELARGRAGRHRRHRLHVGHDRRAEGRRVVARRADRQHARAARAGAGRAPAAGWSPTCRWRTWPSAS